MAYVTIRDRFSIDTVMGQKEVEKIKWLYIVLSKSYSHDYKKKRVFEIFSKMRNQEALVRKAQQPSKYTTINKSI